LLGSVTDDGLPNKSLTALWSKVKGSGSVTFSNAKSASTIVTFSSPGTYTLRLTATDGALYRSDDIVLTVDPPSAANQPPVVNAGPDQMITLPAIATLSGTVSDDGLPTGSALTRSWSKVTGPGSVTFSNATSLNPTATFSAAGTYTLRLTASDGKATTTDDMIVVVSASTPANKAPVVNAGPNQTVTLPAGPTLSGSATDDGLPTGSTISANWTKVSGPGTVVFVNVNSLNASAVMSSAGTYTLRLTVSDGTLSSSDDVIITVNPVAQTNKAPVVNAGPDQTIGFPASATLAGSATDDGLPTGSTLAKTWSKASGPGTVTFGNVSALSTTASFSVAGVYTLRLSATDSALSASDDVVITVNVPLPVNQAPVVNAGPGQTITFPAAANLSGSAIDDGLPMGSTLTAAWSKVSGPGIVSFGPASALSTTATFSATGTYVLQLTASDGLLSGSSSLSVTVLASSIATKTIFVSQNSTGAGTGVDCSNALPISFVNNAANWGTGTAQIGPGSTVSMCGTIAGGVGMMFPVSTKTESTAIPSLSYGNPEPKLHPLFLTSPNQ
jgi:PKD repeat protein